MESYRIRAHNTATASENRIHDDRTAAAHGFRGGLVPGFTIYGYLTVPIVRQFGMEWLNRGGLRVRFLHPVYEGDEILVEPAGSLLSVRNTAGAVCAEGELCWPDSAAPDPALYPEDDVPQNRPPASADSLASGRVLGSLHRSLSLPDEAFLREQGETLTLYREGILHPAALLSLSNHLLLENVQLGPWIHVASQVRNFSLVRDGEDITVRGRVAQRFERKGHQFVELDVLVVADRQTRVVQQVHRTAIYEPRSIARNKA